MNRFGNIDEAIDWLSNRRNLHIGLAKFKEILAKENLINRFKVIHVAGTNGKGSTVNFIKDILREANCKVGTFTGPHLIKHQDRIRINDEYIADDVLLSYLNEYYSFFKAEKMNMFEIDTFIMIRYFNEHNVEYGIIETGIGGRLDCTNVFDDKEMAIITSIGFDHMERLGNTLEKIAYEKAGIIKNNSLILCGYINDSCFKVIEDIGNSLNNKLFKIEPYQSVNGKSFVFEGEEYTLFDEVEYQKANASLAIKACKLLNIEEKFIKKGIKKSKWAGRFETMSNNPKIIIDGAHNLEGVTALINSLKNVRKPIGIIFSALEDKEVEGMINLLKENSDFIILTEFDFYRVKRLKDIDLPMEKIHDFKMAIEEGVKRINEGTLIICGSLYFISAVREYLICQRQF